MKITLNGTERDVVPGTSLDQLLQDAGYAQRRVAVEVNRQIVPRGGHAGCVLSAGDQVEIVHAIGGG